MSSEKQYINEFLFRNHLSPDYLNTAQSWFNPIIKALKLHHFEAKKTTFVGVNGSQGSGKSTLSDYFATVLKNEYGLSTLVLSLDDFYLTKSQRLSLSKEVHPLFATRGVPGTHDTPLLHSVLQALKEQKSVSIPRFNKAIDDRVDEALWDEVTSADIVLVEGWCWGTCPQHQSELAMPLNKLEEESDNQGVWRRHVNTSLENDYLALYDFMDLWIMLQAPSFESVWQWRCEQEHKLIARTGVTEDTMDDAQISVFIQHYQRLTEHSLCTLAEKCNWVLKLDNERKIIESLSNAD
jgi:D-glycerate 3-kinase